MLGSRLCIQTVLMNGRCEWRPPNRVTQAPTSAKCPPSLKSVYRSDLLSSVSLASIMIRLSCRRQIEFIQRQHFNGVESAVSHLCNLLSKFVNYLKRNKLIDNIPLVNLCHLQNYIEKLFIWRCNRYKRLELIKILLYSLCTYNKTQSYQ